jgi:DNA ligase D-like protein (predicted polymerase)
MGRPWHDHGEDEGVAVPRTGETETVQAGGRAVAISNPRKRLFPRAGYTKLDLVRYYLAVAEGALRAAGGRPSMLVRYPDGIDGEFFYQKRAPRARPDWIDVVELRFPSGRAAEEVVPRDPAALVWLANLACLELHPHPVRADDLEHPDELRVDLDPVPGVAWPQVREVARVVRATLAEFGLTGWPKTSGKRGLHVYARIERRWGFDQVRRAALALARDVERRAPRLATSKWWKEERHGVFVDYNQNARDRTMAAAYSRCARPPTRASRRRSHGRSSTPAIRASSRSRPCPRASPPSAIRTRPWMPTRARSSRCSRSPRATSARGGATRPGRRTMRSGAASRCGCSPRAGARRNIRCSRSRAPGARPMRSPGSSAGSAATRTRPRTWPRPTCWSMPCADVRPPGRGCG